MKYMKIHWTKYHKECRKNIKQKNKHSYAYHEMFSVIGEGIADFFEGLLKSILGLVLAVIMIILLPFKIFNRATRYIWMPWFYDIRLRFRLIFNRKTWKMKLMNAPLRPEYDWIERYGGRQPTNDSNNT